MPTSGILLLIVTTTLLSCLISCSNPERDPAVATLIWSDEFDTNGLPDNTKWSYSIGANGWGNAELQYYNKARRENARVENGVLIIEARKEDSFVDAFGTPVDFTSARLVSKGRGEWQYGRIEVRAKLPKGTGTWPAIWMLPTNNVYGTWPKSGEIDIMEHVGFDMNRVHSGVHFSKRFGDDTGHKSLVIDNVDTEFHVYTADWGPEEIHFSVDGTVHNVFKNPGTGWKDWPFDQPFYVILNIAVGGHWGGKEGVDPDIWPQSMEVDYVRVYDLGDTIEPEKLSHYGINQPLITNIDFTNGTSPWLMLTRKYSDSGQISEEIASWSGQSKVEDHVSNSSDGSVTFRQFDAPKTKTENFLAQYFNHIPMGLEPGDTLKFSGTANKNVSSQSVEAEAFIIKNSDSGFLPSSVFTDINTESGEFLVTTTLLAEKFNGLSIGFVIRSNNGAADSITFSDLTLDVEKSSNR